MAHRARTKHAKATPVHLTLHARKGLPSLRAARLFTAVRESIGAASSDVFRVLHFSVVAERPDTLIDLVEQELETPRRV